MDTQLKTKLKLALADNWKTLHTRGSVIFSGVIAIAAPTGAVLRETWNQMPDDLKQVLPHNVQQGISYTVLALTFLALRYTTVKKVVVIEKEEEHGPN